VLLIPGAGTVKKWNTHHHEISHVNNYQQIKFVHLWNILVNSQDKENAVRLVSPMLFCKQGVAVNDFK